MPFLRRMTGLSLISAVALVLLLCASLLLPASASGQSYTFNPLFTFPNARSSSGVSGTFALDSDGNVYGVQPGGGSYGAGQIFELVKSGNSYSEQILFTFPAGMGVQQPAGLVRDSSGNLFGTANSGGQYGYGAVWELQYQAGAYQFIDLYDFTGGTDGSQPAAGVAIDAAGNLFGTTTYGGNAPMNVLQGGGVVFELSYQSPGAYYYINLYSFQGNSDGQNPYTSVTVDKNGNLFGANGSLYELQYQGYPGNYVFKLLHPYVYGDIYAMSLNIDSSGNLFGLTYSAANNTNTYGVYELPYSSGGYSSTLETLYTFGAGQSPVGLAVDGNDNLFGTIWSHPSGDMNGGTLYQLVNSAGSYSPTTLYTFSGNAPNTGPQIMPDGNLLGTAVNANYGTDVTVWDLNVPPPSVTTSLTLTPSANPVTSGDPLTLTATVMATPSQTVAGSVTFSAGSTVLGTATVSNNTASITLSSSSLPTGNDTISATFSSTATNVSGGSGTLVETVNAASTGATLNGNNIFNGNQTVNGTVSATSFVGNGAGLTNVTAAGLACQGCITNYQLGINYAAGDAQGGNALNALNAQALNGIPSSGFAITGAGGNTFAGPQIVNGSITANGALNGTSASFSGPLASSGLALAPGGSATSSQAFNSSAFDLPASLYNSNAGAAQNLVFRWQAEPIAATNNTAAPAATLNLLYAANGNPAETGLSVNANGTLNFAPGQTFPGALTGGSSPTFATVTATTFQGGSFAGNGSGLTGVEAAGLLPSASIPGTQVNGPVASAIIAANLSGSLPESQVNNLTTDLANAVSSSESFATTAANTAQTNAQNFASAAAGNAQANAIAASESFATTAANTAQINAQNFASAAAGNAQANAIAASETFATSAAGAAQANAITAAENFGNHTFLPLTGGTLTGALSSPEMSLSPSATATSSQAFASGGLDTAASLYNSNTGAAQNLTFRWQAEPAAGTNNTSAPSATLNLLFGAGGAPAETGVTVAPNGALTATSFSGDGSRLTNVNATTFTGSIQESQVSNLTSDLANAVTTSESFASNAANAAQSNAQTFATNAANTAQTAAQSFATTAANNAQNTAETFATNAANTAQSNAETFATSAASAAGGAAVSTAENYAKTTFVPLAGGTMTGALQAPSLNSSGDVTAAGAVQGASVTASGAISGATLTIGGGTPITQYVSVKQPITLPAIAAGECTTLETAALTGFTPGDTDSISLGIPATLSAGLGSGHGPAVVLTYHAWETTTSPSSTITIQVCNVGARYAGGATGTIRVDILKH